MEDNEKKPEVYEREKLYDEVWVEPVKIVARRYGVSDVALAKHTAALLPCCRVQRATRGSSTWAGRGRVVGP